MIDLDKAEAAVDKALELDSKRTPKQWQWTTPNSHRRLGVVDGKSEGVAYGTTHADGTGDIVINERDMAFVEGTTSTKHGTAALANMVKGLVKEFRVKPLAPYEENTDLASCTSCKKCGAEIVEYHEYTGLLPDEFVRGRRATHSWLVCELRQKIGDLETTEVDTSSAAEVKLDAIIKSKE